MSGLQLRGSEIKRITLFLMGLILLPSVSFASETVTVCAKQGGGKAYPVNATVLDGAELNQKTSSVNYSPFSTYVVIFWSKSEASIIEMEFKELTVLGVDGKDLQGRRWEISTSQICF